MGNRTGLLAPPFRLEGVAHSPAQDSGSGAFSEPPSPPVSVFDGLEATAPRTLVDVFTAAWSTWPRKVALEDGSRRLSFEQLRAEANDLARRLSALGIGRGDRVGIRVPSGTAELYIAVLGVLLAGGAYVPVDFADPGERAELIWRDVDACAVIGPNLTITERRRGRGLTGPARLDDECWVIFTSGSTGVPKGVAVRHRSAAAFVDAEVALWRVEPHDRVMAGLSVAFDASCEEMWLAWRNGAALVACPRSVVQSGTDLGAWIARRRISVVSTVPTLAAMWDDDALANVRLIILGGEACPEELGWRLAVGREVWNTYGPTEATVVSTAAPIIPGQPVSIGRPLAGYRVAVVDEQGQAVPVGQVGELVIAGVGLGCYLDAGLDASRFAALPGLGWDRAYRTGDMVRADDHGLEFRGRRDDQVKVSGRRIELAEIDAHLAELPGVRAAAAAVRRTPAGNLILVGYVVGDVDPTALRRSLAERLPEGIVPLVVRLEQLPLKNSGKVDRAALPWPPPSHSTDRTPSSTAMTETAAWLAEGWAEQLGPQLLGEESDFFESGGTSMAAAKLVSVLRSRFPSVAVADVYHHRRLGALAAHLDQLSSVAERPTPEPVKGRRFGALQLLGVSALIALASLQWLVGVLAYNQWYGVGLRIGWFAVVVTWLLIASAPGRAALVIVVRRGLLGQLRPGRYRRDGWVSWRIWFVERLAQTHHLDALAGTPWAVRYTRWLGMEVGEGARLATLPSPSGLVRIGAGATLETDVDLRGWWVEGSELVVGEVVVGAGARIGTRALLMPGASVGAGAEIEPGSVVNGRVPAGERWSGSPARPDGLAGESWPAEARCDAASRRPAHAMFALGLGALTLLPVAAAAPSFFLLNALGSFGTLRAAVQSMLVVAPLMASLFLVSYALLVALASRGLTRLIRPGWHADNGRTAWALWFSGALMEQCRGVLFPLYSTVYTRTWLRLLGIAVGARTEVSTAVGLNPLVRLGDMSFVTDDVVFAGTRARGGQIEVRPIEVGSRSFVGNGAILRATTKLGDDSLVGVLSSPPLASADGTSWLGLPPIEFPRIPERSDPSRTTTPSRRLVASRGAVEILRILLPGTVSVALGVLVLLALQSLGTEGGWPLMVLGAPLVLGSAALVAVGLTVAAKWLLIGRYERAEHPLWSFFVWRDELVNSLHEQLAGAWLLSSALGSPVMPAYLRAMGSKVGRHVWFESLAVTEFDLVHLGNRSAVNRGACIETHLFHDRLLRMAPAFLGDDSTLGPNSAILPETELGEGCSVGARSVVLRGERLPPRTRWAGVPVATM